MRRFGGRLRSVVTRTVICVVSFGDLLDRSTLCPVYSLIEMADFESKNVACPPVRRYTSNACESITLRGSSALFEGGGWELSGGSCKLRLFTLESSPYQGEDFLLFGLLLILFPICTSNSRKSSPKFDPLLWGISSSDLGSLGEHDCLNNRCVAFAIAITH